MLVTRSSSELMTYSTKARFSRNQSEPPSTAMPSGIFLSPRRHMCVSHSKKSRSRPCFLMNLQRARSATCQIFFFHWILLLWLLTIMLISDGTGEYLTSSYQHPLVHFNKVLYGTHRCEKKQKPWIIFFFSLIHFYMTQNTRMAPAFLFQLIQYDAYYSAATHRALSLPWDLMKFMLRYLERKATSWSLVLKGGKERESEREMREFSSSVFVSA